MGSRLRGNDGGGGGEGGGGRGSSLRWNDERGALTPGPSPGGRGGEEWIPACAGMTGKGAGFQPALE